MNAVRICPACREHNDPSRHACRKCRTSLFVPVQYVDPSGVPASAGSATAAAAPRRVPKPPARRKPAGAALDCPRCGVKMERGTVRLGNTPMQKLLLGVSWLELFFREGGVAPRRSLLSPLEERAAAHCGQCDGFWVDARPGVP